LQPGFQTGGDFLEQLQTWENNVRKYEEAAGETLPHTIKTAMVLQHAPPLVKTYLQLNIETFQGSHSRMRMAIESYMLTQKNWSPASLD